MLREHVFASIYRDYEIALDENGEHRHPVNNIRKPGEKLNRGQGRGHHAGKGHAGSKDNFRVRGATQVHVSAVRKNTFLLLETPSK